MESKANRRKWLRYKCSFSVKAKVFDGRKKKIWKGAGTIKNIGGGGSFLELKNMSEKLVTGLLKRDYSLLLGIELPDSFFRVKAEAEVMWVENSVQEGEIVSRVGISFKNLHPKKQRHIEDFVEKQIAGEIASYTIKRMASGTQDKHK